MAAGDNLKAISLFEQAVQLSPNDAISLNNLAWLYHQSRDKRALDTAKKSYSLAPNSGAIADTYGWILVQNGNREEGIKILEKAVKLAPELKEIADHLRSAKEL